MRGDPARGRRGESGLTMIELMVTMAVTMIGLVGLLAMFVISSRGEADAAAITEATAIAEDLLETYRGQSIDELNTIVTIPGELVLPDVIGAKGRTYVPKLVVDAVSSDSELVRIRLEVSWAERGGAVSTDADAGPGDNESKISLEVIRTRSEVH